MNFISIHAFNASSSYLFNRNGLNSPSNMVIGIMRSICWCMLLFWRAPSLSLYPTVLAILGGEGPIGLVLRSDKSQCVLPAFCMGSSAGSHVRCLWYTILDNDLEWQPRKPFPHLWQAQYPLVLRPQQEPRPGQSVSVHRIRTLNWNSLLGSPNG